MFASLHPLTCVVLLMVLKELAKANCLTELYLLVTEVVTEAVTVLLLFYRPVGGGRVKTTTAVEKAAVPF